VQVEERIVPADGWHNPVVKAQAPAGNEVQAA
jgi:hypothetical protein